MGEREGGEGFADFYDLYTEGFEGDVPLYLDLAAKFPEPVLEVGCSTGRVTRRLAEAGCEVVGLETEREMLALARERLRPFADRVRLHDHDLRHSALPERFHLGFVTLHTFNALIDVEEQRLFLRHLIRSLRAPAVVVLDCFCPISQVAPEQLGKWRVIERTSRGRHVLVRDRREMLNPLLERRTQRWRIDGGPERQAVTHRRFVPPVQARHLLEEAGFEAPRWVQGYDPSTCRPIDNDDRPSGPFLVIADL